MRQLAVDMIITSTRAILIPTWMKGLKIVS